MPATDSVRSPSQVFAAFIKKAEAAFGGADPWYAYDLLTHTLSPQPYVYVVRTGDGGHFKIAFTNYYDAAGTSGFPTFRWALLAE